MAVIKNGANGTLSGKAGSVVFVTNGNTTYARGLPKKTKKKTFCRSNPIKVAFFPYPEIYLPNAKFITGRI
ncbi:hypothetical protein [Sphingobacterium sp. 18053]|uniref:hypothetical protein n=1 Tax=Sphingobacterium sp. 18053 TaxID=2681401 RepID=UPI00135C320B|nr:hypothetical protein [Sphingobacterium sp. 18053]